ncbi:MAG: aminoglycoside adenylyltransferase domain-containing protein [Anaerolineales bacterium]
MLGESFVGLYLYGSLASGDFDPETSDIDFLVVTAGEIPNELIPALEAMHARLAASGAHWAKKLEGRYLPQASLRRYTPTDPARPCVNEGRFYLTAQEPDWIIQRHVLREHAVVIAGPPLTPLIDPVSPEALRGAVLGYLRGWWAPMLNNPARLRHSEYQAYAVLSMFRALYTLHHSAIASKPAAARWAQATLGEPPATLIAHALAWRPGVEMNCFNETVELIRYTVEVGDQITQNTKTSRLS